MRRVAVRTFRGCVFLPPARRFSKSSPKKMEPFPACAGILETGELSSDKLILGGVAEITSPPSNSIFMRPPIRLTQCQFFVAISPDL